ncbi:hypothetical protein ACFXG4_27430 [Nocardia sp. NPDC059246]|uniref:hypothetical protein n=1 Tax=unclassified Nocardia TaxID=2637762 RepID=UPI0036A7C8F1
MSVRDELDKKFAELDNESKLTITMLGFSQCAAGYKRFLGLNQLHHSYSFLYTEEAVSTAEATDPIVAESVAQLRDLVKEAVATPRPFHDEEFRPVGAAYERDFLWSDTFEEPVFYDIRHAARDGLRAIEAKLPPRA